MDIYKFRVLGLGMMILRGNSFQVQKIKKTMVGCVASVQSNAVRAEE